jgi:hypothetical protein
LIEWSRAKEWSVTLFSIHQRQSGTYSRRNAQIDANRLNAENCTGPRSAEGKAVSRFNALKSGLGAHSLIIPGEDPAALEALTSGYHE